MTSFLKFVGLVNAAVWCGASVFLILALPAVFSPALKHALTPAGVGFAAQAIIARFFIVQYWCGGIALAHLLAEWFYYGTSPWRLNFALLAVVITLALVGGLWIQPKMRELHLAKYFGKTAAQQEEAGRKFASLHAASETANLLMLGSLVWYLWRVSKGRQVEQFSFSKMKG